MFVKQIGVLGCVLGPKRGLAVLAVFIQPPPASASRPPPRAQSLRSLMTATRAPASLSPAHRSGRAKPARDATRAPHIVHQPPLLIAPERSRRTAPVALCGSFRRAGRESRLRTERGRGGPTYLPICFCQKHEKSAPPFPGDCHFRRRSWCNGGFV